MGSETAHACWAAALPPLLGTASHQSGLYQNASTHSVRVGRKTDKSQTLSRGAVQGQHGLTCNQCRLSKNI